jgi:hypothetical protein
MREKALKVWETFRAWFYQAFQGDASGHAADEQRQKDAMGIVVQDSHDPYRVPAKGGLARTR